MFFVGVLFCFAVLFITPFMPRWAQPYSVEQDEILSVTSHINCIVARCLIKVVYLTTCAFIRS